MKSLSLYTVLFGIIVAVFVRFGYYTNDAPNGYNATTWDAFGYYAYLPSTFIYKDVKTMSWYPEIEKKYHVSGGYLYQADTLENGNLAFKYLGGVAVMQSPFFLIGHGIAHATDAPEDGFSWPYQYAIIWGAICWFVIGLLFLRKVLLHFFSESITSITLLLIVLATNLLQYISIDGAMSHAFIFPLYSLLLWMTIKWHDQPKWKYLFAMGVVIGLATISRPTELVMIFIPLLWKWERIELAPSKWRFLWQRKWMIALIILSVLIGMFPQLLYWKIATGSWIYNVGSKWFFLNPWWRVLIGFEKGWFIYTPVTIFMFLGLFMMKGKAYGKAILTFGLINLWIIISWSDWRYGASYSTRALTQSYPVYAIALAAFLSRFFVAKKRLLIGSIGLYLIFVNGVQLWQYNRTILHYDHMNFSYYKAIYLDTDPTPLDYSLLDSASVKPSSIKPLKVLELKNNDTLFLAGKNTLINIRTHHQARYLHFSSTFTSHSMVDGGFWSFDLFSNGKVIKQQKIRLGFPYAKHTKMKKYEAYILLDQKIDSVQFAINHFDSLRIVDLKIKLTTLQ